MVVSCEICFIFSVLSVLTLLCGVAYSFLINLYEISKVKLVVKNLPAKGETCERRRFSPWVGKIPWRCKWQATPISLSGESHGQRNLEGYRPWGRKGLDMTEAT